MTTRTFSPLRQRVSDAIEAAPSGLTWEEWRAKAMVGESPIFGVAVGSLVRSGAVRRDTRPGQEVSGPVIYRRHTR